MRTFGSIAFTALAAFTLTPVAAVAQDATDAVQNDPHAGLYAAMEAGVDQDVLLDTTLRGLAAQFVTTNPALAALESEHPGVMQALIDAMRPTLAAYSERVRVLYRPRMVAVISQIMTEEESVALAQFYRSDLGRRTLTAASSNMSVANAGQQAISGEQVTAEAVNRDLTQTGMQAFLQLSVEDRAELMRITLSTPGFTKLPELQQQIAPVRAEMENSPPTAQEQAAIVEAVTATMERYTS